MSELHVIFDKNENNLILKATKMKNSDSTAWVTWLYIQIWIRFIKALMKYAIYSIFFFFADGCAVSAKKQPGELEVKQEVKNCLWLYNLLASVFKVTGFTTACSWSNPSKMVFTDSKRTSKAGVEQSQMSAYSVAKRQTLDIFYCIPTY